MDLYSYRDLDLGILWINKQFDHDHTRVDLTYSWYPVYNFNDRSIFFEVKTFHFLGE